jgi:hypothetical protein
MKKLFLLSAIVVSTITLSAQEANVRLSAIEQRLDALEKKSLTAQEANVSLSAALPVGNFADITTFGLNLDANYLWEVSEQFDLGVATGYHYYFGEDLSFGYSKPKAWGFLPISAAGRFNASEDFTIGADVGYAIGINPNGNDGGFYYAPKIQYGIIETLDIVVAYKRVSLDGLSLGAITLGVEYRL